MKDAQGMKGLRSRNLSGPLRKKNGHTHISTIEKIYDVNFGVRGDMHLKTLLLRENKYNLKDLINNS
jgi:hypothetical protein